MCQQVVVVATTNNKMKTSYSIKQVLKTLFKKQQKQQQKPQGSLESLESVDNLRNAQVEEAYYAEIDENAANEKLAQLAHSQEFEIVEEQENEEEEDVYVPVRFARTTAGTFFWTTNLQPVASVEPAMCYSMQFQDRWAQA
ncbi:enhancer of split malpha protein [Drosophila sechellia]|uniref:E(Spl) region transcript malpha n=3 Tax=melanogaster subgroup TaxID=32351 RepID=Q5S410_DROSI|nr:enhancer of split malpha protein [Drosophila sechellia]XP_002105005.1 enhancer of split malpha protein [Drosophila simulans]XP_033165424.1 enhancer of split malpha protein [Drosophila mauritiana]AAV59254.1 enhancer of split malpha protein [Drosophila simulans]EDW45072.1 GM10295 [Drosophila sechellia]EDX14508.1 E(spl) region transcript malpha [Drosophila simulans]KMZ06000.1 E(spl) region transcript malpha [Drosophila simulans]